MANSENPAQAGATAAVPGATSAPAASRSSVLTQIRDVVWQSGIDSVAELYNEALELARDGHYGHAQTRLNALLALAPNDGEAHLLLAKVLVAGQQWRRAMTSLDDAAVCGTAVPEELRSAIVRNLNADEESAEVQRQAVAAREQAEVVKLRSEAKRLRADAASQEIRIGELEAEAKRWGWVATGTSALAILLVLARIVSALSAPAVSAAAPPAPVAAPVVEGAPAPIDPASPRNGGLAEQAAEALKAAGVLDGAEIVVTVRGSTAQLSGYAPIYAQAKKAQDVVKAVPGIESVGIDGLVIKARRDGTTHVVKGGETLGQISLEHYGRSSLHTRITEANPELGANGQLKVGMTLKIPAVKDFDVAPR